MSAAKRSSGAWPDVLAFALGLGAAGFLDWNTTDLVWSLWLSSLLVGYALILWLLSAPLRELIRNIAADRSNVAGPGPKAAAIGLYAAGTLFGVAFFTVHFGGFHVGHATFLSMLFPLTPDRDGAFFFNWPAYQEAFSRYWMFLPAAFLAERHAFARASSKPDVSVTADAIAKRKAAGNRMMLPYKGVIRMHLLIFFFVAARFAQIDGFVVYALVYAVYFFPWRMLRREPDAVAAAA